MYDYTSMIFTTVPMWGSEVANSKKEKDTPHKHSKRSDVGMQCHHY